MALLVNERISVARSVGEIRRLATMGRQEPDAVLRKVLENLETKTNAVELEVGLGLGSSDSSGKHCLG